MAKPFDKVKCSSCGTNQLAYQVGSDGRCTSCTVHNRKPDFFEEKKPAQRSR